MVRMVVLIGLAGCAACREEPRIERASPPLIATATRTAPSGPPNAPERPPRRTESAANSATPAAGDGRRAARACLPPGPAVCTANGSIWATAEVSGRSTHPAVRSAAAERALTTLTNALGPGIEIQANAEIIRVAPCGPRTMAIARVKTATHAGTDPMAIARVETATHAGMDRPRAKPAATPDRRVNRGAEPLPACPSEVAAWAVRRAAGTCPAWVEAYALRDGSTIVGIGHGPPGKNRSLATSVAVNRARSHAARLAHFDAENPNSPVRSPHLRELTRNIVSCAGRIFARVGYSPAD